MLNLANGVKRYGKKGLIMSSSRILSSLSLRVTGILLLLIAVLFLMGCGGTREVFMGFTMKNNTAMPQAFLFFRDKAGEKRSQLIGVGWYEYSLEGKGAVTFVSEGEHGKIIESRKSTALPSDICDLYAVVVNKVNKGVLTAIPDDVREQFTKMVSINNFGNANFDKFIRGQSVKKIANDVLNAKYYIMDVTEPGFIQFSRMGLKKIVFGNSDSDGRIVYIRLIGNEDSIEFMALENIDDIVGIP